MNPNKPLPFDLPGALLDVVYVDGEEAWGSNYSLWLTPQPRID